MASTKRAAQLNSKTKKVHTPPRTPPKKVVSTKPARTRRRLSLEQRAKILAEAAAQKLTGKQVAAKYGIATVTYYLWRRQSGRTGRRRRVGARSVDGRAGTAQVRAEVQAKVRELLPAIVRDEVARFLKATFQ